MNWTNCYNDSWKDHIVPEAFSHPAKMAYGLLKRILDHCKDKGWGGVIVDPFGGIGSTGILGAYDGYQVICCELEAKFVSLAKQNFDLHRKAFEEFGCSYPVIIQGDSRKLCEVVEVAELIVSSPPYAESCGTPSLGSVNKDNWGDEGKDIAGRRGLNADYGQTPGQLGAMKAGKVDMVISSPPYAETMNSKDTKFIDKHHSDIGRKIDSPGAHSLVGKYGQTKGNLGNLKAGDVDVILSSPPYEGSNQDYKSGYSFIKTERKYDKEIHCGQAKYGQSDGQLGQEQGPTFWQAAKEILEQCHKILRPGGHAIWVCKDFVRKGQRVPFSDDWQRLCESVGFKTLHRHKAMLVKEDVKDDLFGGQIVKKTERKSFFRRLAEAKGSPKIDWEDVICMEK